MERGSIYPSYRYHPDGRSVRCESKEQDAALGDEWSDKDVRGVSIDTPSTDDTADVVPPADGQDARKKRGRKPKA